LVASDNIIVFGKDNKSVTLGDSIQHKQLFFPDFGEINAVTLLLRFTIELEALYVVIGCAIGWGIWKASGGSASSP
jgi:hypothetical protein